MADVVIDALNVMVQRLTAENRKLKERTPNTVYVIWHYWDRDEDSLQDTTPLSKCVQVCGDLDEAKDAAHRIADEFTANPRTKSYEKDLLATFKDGVDAFAHGDQPVQVGSVYSNKLVYTLSFSENVVA